jgi:hypothetical protein
MVFNNIVDENGTPLSVFAELLREKAKAAGLTTIMVFAAQDGPNKGLHTISNVSTSVPIALIRLGEAMLSEGQEPTAEEPEQVH